MRRWSETVTALAALIAVSIVLARCSGFPVGSGLMAGQ